MKNPFFSIVIPLYNRSGILEERLTYLIQQQFRDFEIVIIDDGSTDNPQEKLKNHIDSNTNIRLFHQSNSERGAARNKGIEISKGEYIVLFDSDDFMHSDHLLKLHQGILDNRYPDFIATKFNFQNEKGEKYSSDIQKYKKGNYDYKLFLDGNPLACNICFKRSIPDLILFEEDRNYAIKEDWMFLISNMKKHKLTLLDDTTISMYDHAERSMKSDNNVIISRTLKAVDWIEKHIPLTKEEKNRLHAHLNYFCGIHSYLEGKRISSISYSINAIINGGAKIKYLELLAKSILGRKFISKIK